MPGRFLAVIGQSSIRQCRARPCHELAGLSLWFDKNQNGISDPEEVIPVPQAGVEALAVRADAWDGQSPMNMRGVRLKDGRVLPSWDWVATSRAAR
ncbi:MAG TPA: hypothetical protein VGH38_20200 [Bryobacteraceae bacterium]|jgi:hypothetical protein